MLFLLFEICLRKLFLLLGGEFHYLIVQFLGQALLVVVGLLGGNEDGFNTVFFKNIAFYLINSSTKCDVLYRATMEAIPANLFPRVGDGDASQASATLEGIVLNLFH